jgi:hypothetical protein
MQTLLPLAVSVLWHVWAVPERVWSTAACAAPGCVCSFAVCAVAGQSCESVN